MKWATEQRWRCTTCGNVAARPGGDLFGRIRLCDWDGCDEPGVYREGVHLTCGSHRIRPESRLAKGTT